MPVSSAPPNTLVIPRASWLTLAAVLLGLLQGLTCLPVAAQGSDDAGGASLPAIALVPAARPAGLAGAYSAIGSGSSTIGINPAGLAREEGKVYTGSARPDMARVGAVTFAFPALDGRVAVGATYVDYDEVLETDENMAVQGTLRPFSLYPSLTYAREQGERWRWGATLKLARETLGDFEGSSPAYGAGFDAGVQYQPARRNVGFGASVTNIGRQFTGYFDGDEDLGSLPGAARAGVFYQPQGQRQLVLTADLEAPLHAAPALALGGEYRVMPEWQLRAGTRWSRDDLRNALGWIDPNAGITEQGGEALKLAAGTTLRIGPVAVDYAAQWWRELGLVHALTVAWSSGE
jgi:hypothetical protein